MPIIANFAKIISCALAVVTCGLEADDDAPGVGLVVDGDAGDVARASVVPHALVAEHVQLHMVVSVLKAARLQWRKYQIKIVKMNFRSTKLGLIGVKTI